MVVKFSGTSILSNELGMIDKASTDNLRVILALHAQFGLSGHRAQVAKSGLKTNIRTERDIASIFTPLDSSR